MTTQKAKVERKLARDLRNLRILPENSEKGLMSRWEHCWGYVSINENTPKKLLHLPLTIAATLLNGSRKGADGA